MNTLINDEPDDLSLVARKWYGGASGVLAVPFTARLLD
jgi:hypothetical protein